MDAGSPVRVSTVKLTMLLALALAVAVSRPTAADQVAAAPIQQAHRYLQSHAAPDYWALSPFYTAQSTPAACSVASVAMVINALRGAPFPAEGLVTQSELLKAVGDPGWVAATGEQGDGVTVDALVSYLRRGLAAFGLRRAQVEVFHPVDNSTDTLARMRALLIANEQGAQDIALAVFDQGAVTGEPSAGHISPVGAYDLENRRVLIMDVDRQWYGPYWVPDDILLDAMLRPDTDDPGGHALVIVRMNPPSP